VPNLPQGEIPHGTGRRSRARAGNRSHGPSDATGCWTMAGLVMFMSFCADRREPDEVVPWGRQLAAPRPNRCEGLLVSCGRGLR